MIRFALPSSALQRELATIRVDAGCGAGARPEAILALKEVIEKEPLGFNDSKWKGQQGSHPSSSDFTTDQFIRMAAGGVGRDFRLLRFWLGWQGYTVKGFASR